MPEPHPGSSDWYIWIYRTMHLLFHMSTTYFTHKSFWEAFQAKKINLEKTEFLVPQIEEGRDRDHDRKR